MNDLPEPDDLATEERLRRAVRFRDAEVTASADALDRIRERTAAGRSRRDGFVRPGWLLAAAAMVLAVVAGALMFSRDDGAPDVAVEPPVDDDTPTTTAPGDGDDDPASATSSTTSVPSTTSAPPTVTTIPSLPELTPQERADQGLVVWPLDSRSFDDPSTLAFSYASQALGIDDPDFTVEDGDEGTAVVSVAQIGEDGEPFGEATRLHAVALDDFNWVLVTASSPEVTLESATTVSAGLVRVTGQGRSFEGAAHLVVRSQCDPEGVITPVQVGGGPEFGSFDQVAAHVECAAPLVIELATDVVTDFGVPFVTAAAVFPDSASTLPSTLVVMRVEPDDVLNVRSGPGVDNDVVATLAPDATGIVRLGGVETVADADWWEIATPDGAEGWAHSDYLSVQPVAEPGELVLPDPLPALLGQTGEVSLSDRGVYVGGIGVYADASTPFQQVDPAAFTNGTDHDWNPFPDEAECDDECIRTVEEFLALTDLDLDRVELPHEVDLVAGIEPTEQFMYGPLDQLDLFGSLHSVTIEVPATSDEVLDWRRYHVWFDWAGGRPEIIAVWRWGWTP